MLYKGIIFDLDGTLINSLEDLADSMNQVLGSRGYKTYPAEKYKYFIGKGVRYLASRALELDDPPKELLEELVEEFYRLYNHNWNRKTRLYRGIPDMLDTLAGQSIPMAILSNKPDLFTKKCAAHYISQWSFQTVQGALESVPIKPDPTGALLLAMEMNLLPEEILFIGDSDIDMQTAVKAGMTAIGVLWGFRESDELKEAGASYLVKEPAEIGNFF